MRRPALRALGLLCVMALVSVVMLSVSEDAWAWTCPEEPEAFRRCIERRHASNPPPPPPPALADMIALFLKHMGYVLFGGLPSLLAALIASGQPERGLLCQPRPKRILLAGALWGACGIGAIILAGVASARPLLIALLATQLLFAFTIGCWTGLATPNGRQVRSVEERRASSHNILKLLGFLALPLSIFIASYLVKKRAEYGMGHPSQLQTLALSGGWALGFALIWTLHQLGAERVATAWAARLDAHDAKLRRLL